MQVLDHVNEGHVGRQRAAEVVGRAALLRELLLKALIFRGQLLLQPFDPIVEIGQLPAIRFRVFRPGNNQRSIRQFAACRGQISEQLGQFRRMLAVERLPQPPHGLLPGRDSALPGKDLGIHLFGWNFSSRGN